MRSPPEPLPTRRSHRLDDPLRLQALAEYRDPEPARLHQLQEVVALAGRLLRAGTALLALVDRNRVVVHAQQGARPLTTIAITPVWETILRSDPLFVWQAGAGGGAAGTPASGVRASEMQASEMQASDVPAADIPAADIPAPDMPALAPGMFAAAPLVSPEHAVVGALCISDPVTRVLTTDERATLTMLARQAMSLMELHRVIRREAAARDEAASMAGRLQLAFSVAGLGDWTWTSASDRTVLSPRAGQIFALPSGQPIERRAFRDAVAPEHQELLRRQFEAAIRERRDLHVEFRLRREHGDEAWVQTHGTGLYDASGRIVEMVGVVQDISAHRLAEAQMRIREDRAWMKAELVNRVQNLDHPGDVAIHAIRVVVERFGLRCGGFARIGEAGELIGARARVVGEPIDVERGIGMDVLDADLLRRLGAASPVEIDIGGACLIDEPAGTAPLLPPRTALLCPLTRLGRPVALFWFAADRDRGWRGGEAQAIQSIVDLAFAYHGRAQARRSAKAGERRLLLIADWMPQLAWLANAEGHSVWFNQRWREYAGCSPESLVGGGWLALCHPDDRADVEASMRRAMAADAGWEATFRLRRADGQFRWHLSRALSFATGNDDEPLLWFATLTDVTEQRQLAEEREALLETERVARLEAESAGRLKDEFLATLSHELRTPLTAMLGWSQVLRRTGLDPGLVRQGVEIIERNAQLQSQIVEDLLDMSAIASGQLKLDRQPVELRALVESAVDAITPLARSRGIRIESTLPGGELPVVADPGRLLQVMNKLLLNAIKFSPLESSITVMLAAVGDQAELVVADHGIGMPAEFLPHVFERFRQADGSNTRLHGGLGLGLAIVHQLLELHGGSVVADSAGPGKGSTFTVRLPRS